MPRNPNNPNIRCSLCASQQPGLARLIAHVEGPMHQMDIALYRATFPGQLPDASEEEAPRSQHTSRDISAIQSQRSNNEIALNEWVTEQKTRFVNICGYTDGPILDSTLQLMKINRKLERSYRDSELRLHPNLEILKAIRDNTKQIVSNIESMEATKNALTSNDIAQLHAQTMKEAEDYIRDHIGEFSWGCPSCSQVITAGGIPHWSLIKDSESNWVPWSPELIKLVGDGRIRLYEAAHVLRTSIEGLLMVAQERRHKWPRRINKIDEERLLRERMLAEE